MELGGLEFAQSQDHPLLQVPAGTVIDDLEGLDGCWGSYARPDMIAPPKVNAEFYRFDIETNRLFHQILQRGPKDLFGVLTLQNFDVAGEWVYSLDVSAPDRITIRLLSVAFDATVADVVVGTHVVEDAQPAILQVTLQDNAFKYGESFDASPDVSAPHRAILVFFRFECPEQEAGP